MENLEKNYITKDHIFIEVIKDLVEFNLSVMNEFLNEFLKFLVVSKFMIQGGDIINFDGTGGESIYGSYFEDENFIIKHKEGGLLSMVNEGKSNTNSSQFIITTESSSQLNDTNVVFGKVIKGFGAIQELNQVDVVNDKPIEVILFK